MYIHWSCTSYHLIQIKNIQQYMLLSNIIVGLYGKDVYIHFSYILKCLLYVVFGIQYIVILYHNIFK
jgi:hypothetical protein